MSEAAFNLPAILDLSAAEPLRQTLLERMAEREILLNGAAVDRVSTACLQVLLTAAADCRGKGGRLRLEAPSDALRNAFTTLGLDQHLTEMCAP
ncbi:hypothetical protein GALL_176000 [mine drainage metagenome]|uniref:STAS domain-containing protein n=1 Tax=mine drainage metagenome TaxID=410659 RepID=A0A1J5RXC7_9ZZZZ